MYVPFTFGCDSLHTTAFLLKHHNPFGKPGCPEWVSALMVSCLRICIISDPTDPKSANKIFMFPAFLPALRRLDPHTSLDCCEF